MKLSTIIQNMDAKIFKQIDRFTSDSTYQKVMDRFALLDETIQKWVIRGLLVAIPVIPFIFLISLFGLNMSIKNSVETKREIEKIVELFNEKQNEVQSVGSRIFSQTHISSESDLGSRLRSILSIRNIPADRVSVTSFNSNETPAFVRNEASLSFTGMSISDFTLLTRELLQTERMKISSVNISRDQDTPLISGTIGIIHYSKPMPKSSEL